MVARGLIRGTRARRAGAPATSTRRGRQRAEEILDIALELFAEQGYTSVTIKDIAGRGRINPALIYYYYHNKEDLFVAALKHAVNAALARHGNYARTGAKEAPALVIRWWFETNAILAKPLSQIVMLMLHYRASRRRSTSIQRLIKKFYDAEMGLLAEAIERGIALGVFRPVDVGAAALFVSTHLDGLIVASTIRSDVDLKRALEEFQHILFAYLGYAENRAAPVAEAVAAPELPAAPAA